MFVHIYTYTGILTQCGSTAFSWRCSWQFGLVSFVGSVSCVFFFFCFNKIVFWRLHLHNSIFRDLELQLIRAHFYPAKSDEDFACGMHIGLHDIPVRETFPSLQCHKWLGGSYKWLNPSADYGSNSATNENAKHENLTCLRLSKSQWKS